MLESLSSPGGSVALSLSHFVWLSLAHRNSQSDTRSQTKCSAGGFKVQNHQPCVQIVARFLFSDLMLHTEFFQFIISSEEQLKHKGCPSTDFHDDDGTSKCFNGNMHGCFRTLDI